jgi:hypothetical protein
MFKSGYTHLSSQKLIFSLGWKHCNFFLLAFWYTQHIFIINGGPALELLVPICYSVPFDKPLPNPTWSILSLATGNRCSTLTLCEISFFFYSTCKRHHAVIAFLCLDSLNCLLLHSCCHLTPVKIAVTQNTKDSKCWWGHGEKVTGNNCTLWVAM